MYEQVKTAAGIHMSTFKDEEGKPDGVGDEMLSNMKVPPDLLAKWAS